MSTPHMYLLVFKNPTQNQVDVIRSTFSDFDWSQGFDVEEVVADSLVNEKLIIQFVSFKQFIQKNSNEITLYPTTVEAVLTGKGQFFGSLMDRGVSVENLDTFFCYLGSASESRDQSNEAYFQVEYGKYSSLIKVDTSLEALIN